MDWKTEFREGLRRCAERSPGEKDEVAKEVQTSFERSKPARDQFNKEIEERLKVSRKSMEMD